MGGTVAAMARSTYIAVALVLLMLVGPLGAAAPAGRFSGDPRDIAIATWPGPVLGPAAGNGCHALLYLRAGVFDPVRDAVPTVRGLRDAASPGIYLVQFSRPVSPGDGDAIGLLGARVLGYVPEGGLVVRLPRPAAVAAVAALASVRWACPWQAGWKLDPGLAGARGPLSLSVVSWDASEDVSTALASAGARVEGRLLDVYQVTADASQLGAIAAAAGVSWVEPRTLVTFLMDKATRSTGARAPTDGPYDPASGAVWSYINQTYKFDGINGSSVTVDVTDTGVDGSHRAFSGKLRAYVAVEPGRLNWTDPTGHGTHVAGIVLGDGLYRVGESNDLTRGKYAGVAPGANLTAQSLYNGQYFFRNLTRWSVLHNADISQNSWGRDDSSLWGNYTLDSREYDNATRDADWLADGNQSILVVFSAGNDGTGGNDTISTTAAGKNIITVGAVGNDKFGLGSGTVWAVSSRGPTDDGRIKPDLVAPGDLVVSTWATLDTGTSGSVPGDGGTHSYIGYGGTSMAAPIVSGASALVIDHLRLIDGHSDPSPALVKAMLIASADHLTTEAWPGNGQGWGRVNVSKALVESRTQTLEWVDQSSTLTGVGESMDYTFDVDTGAPLSISLVWTDVSSALYTGKALVNDLDLEVTSPSGKTFLGNAFIDNRSVEGGTADRKNNVEVVYLPTPERGTWTVKVKAFELPPVPGGGSQDFAIAVSGQVNKRYIDLFARNLTIGATDAAEGETIPMRFDISNNGNIPAGPVAWRLEVLDRATGRVVSTVKAGTIAQVLAGGSERVYANWTAVRGRFALQAMPNPYRHIREESYQNNNMTKDFFVKGYGFDAVIPVSLGSGPPGIEVSYNINITNNGNIDDRFLLGREEPPAGWSARLEHTFLSLLAGRGATVRLFVGIPAGAPADTYARVNVSVWSQGNSTYRVELSTQTYVLPVRAVGVALESRQLGAVPGGFALFNFTLTNLGNGPDTLKVTVPQTGGPIEGVSVVVPRATFSLARGGTVQGNFTISLDLRKMSSLPVGAAIAFNLRASSVNDPLVGSSDGGALLVGQLHALTVLDPVPEGFTVPPGSSVTFPLGLGNDGNGLEQVTIDMALPQGWSWKAEPKGFTIETAGTYATSINVTTSVSSEGTVHNLTVRALGKDSKVLLELVVSVEIEWVQGLSVTLSGAYGQNVTQGFEVAFSFLVRNTGNRPDSVNVSFARLTPGLRATAIPADAMFGMGERKAVRVVFNASKDAQLLQGNYDVIFRYAQDVRTQVVRLNVTIELAEPTNGGGGGGGGGGTGGFPLLLAAVAIGLVVGILVAVILLVRTRGQGKKLEQDFFVGANREGTARALESETAAATAYAPTYAPAVAPAPRIMRSGPPPPRPPRSDEGATAPGAPPRCPECGVTMITMGAGGGHYCPVCGKTVGGGGGAPPAGPAESGPSGSATDGTGGSK
jgi:subtilisin family serine protease